MGKKSDKIDAAKAKLKEVKASKNLKAAAKSEKSAAMTQTPVEALPEVPASVPLKKKKTPTHPVAAEKPTFEEIQVEAYHIAQKRMARGIPGTEAEDWIAAEQSLRSARGL